MSVEAIEKKRGRAKKADAEESTIGASTIPANEKTLKTVRRKKVAPINEPDDAFPVPTTSISKKSVKDVPIKTERVVQSKRVVAKKISPTNGNAAVSASTSTILKEATAFKNVSERTTEKLDLQGNSVKAINAEQRDLGKPKERKSEVTSIKVKETGCEEIKIETCPDPTSSTSIQQQQQQQQQFELLDQQKPANDDSVSQPTSSSTSSTISTSPQPYSQNNTLSEGLQHGESRPQVPSQIPCKSNADTSTQPPEQTHTPKETMPASSSPLRSPQISTPQVSRQFQPPSSSTSTTTLASSKATSTSTSTSSQSQPIKKTSPSPTRFSRLPSNLHDPSRLPTPPPRRPTELSYDELKRNPQFKSLSRKYTGIIVGIPIALVTSYVLFERYQKQMIEKGGLGSGSTGGDLDMRAKVDGVGDEERKGVIWGGEKHG